MKPIQDHHFAQDAPLQIAALEWRRSGRVPPVLLLTGPSGIGKRETATLFARWILCERGGWTKAAPEDSGADLFGGSDVTEPSAPMNRSCDECSSCKRAISGSWTDFVEIRGDSDEEEGRSTGALKVDQFRSLKASAGFSAREGGYRIHLITDADRMTTQAANSILKLLEEPPQGWIFLLTASDSTLLLPTIVSRAQTLRLRPLPQATVVHILRTHGVKEDRIDACATLASGSFRRAEELATDEIWDRRKQVFEFLKDPGSQLNALVDWAGADAATLLLLIDLMESAVSSLVRWTLAQPAVPAASYAWPQTDMRGALMAAADAQMKAQGSVAGARSFWLARAEKLAETRALALTPMNRKLLVQDLLMPWLASGRLA